MKIKNSGTHNSIIGLSGQKNGSGLLIEMDELVIVDLDYLLDNTESVLSAARTQRTNRDAS